jgi:membrane protein insertase Oxa1/YidC/SpoIIIJ
MVKIDKSKVDIIFKVMKGLGSAFTLLIAALFALSTTNITKFIEISINDWITICKLLIAFIIFLIIICIIWLFIIFWSNFKNSIDLQNKNDELKSEMKSLQEKYEKTENNRKGLKQEVKVKKKEISELRAANQDLFNTSKQNSELQAITIATQAELIKALQAGVQPNIKLINENVKGD